MRLRHLLASIDGISRLTKLDIALGLQLRPLVERMARCELVIDLVAEPVEGPAGCTRWVLHVMGRQAGSIIQWRTIPIPTDEHAAVEIVSDIYVEDTITNVRDGLGRIRGGLGEMEEGSEPDDLDRPEIRRPS